MSLDARHTHSPCHPRHSMPTFLVLSRHCILDYWGILEIEIKSNSTRKPCKFSVFIFLLNTMVWWAMTVILPSNTIPMSSPMEWWITPYSYWNRVKLCLKRMTGCHRDSLPSYLDECMWCTGFPLEYCSNPGSNPGFLWGFQININPINWYQCGDINSLCVATFRVKQINRYLNLW